MRKQLITVGVVAVAIILATSAFAQGYANRGVSFTPIGYYEDPGPFPASKVLDMNGDGSMLIATPEYYGGYCAIVTYPELEWELIGGNGCMISNDGQTIMATVYDPDTGGNAPGTYTGVRDEYDTIPAPAGIGACGSPGFNLFGMSGNGEFATGGNFMDIGSGCTYYQPYRWDRATNTNVNLGYIREDDTTARGNDISNDGNTIAGYSKMLCGTWRGMRWDDGVMDYIDGQGPAEFKVCPDGVTGCCGSRDCPEYGPVDCVDNACVGGYAPGEACNSKWDCQPGVEGWCKDTDSDGINDTCRGGTTPGAECQYNSHCPNIGEGVCVDGTCVGGTVPGTECTSSYYCTNVEFCDVNPAWDGNFENYKGDGFLVTPDGDHIVGWHYGDSLDDPFLWTSAYRSNPNGSFSRIESPNDWDNFTPYDVSDDGNVVVGGYGWWIYTAPALWIDGVGSMDLQWFLVSQGLDDLWYWTLSSATAVSSDGKIIGGYGYNPEYYFEGFVIDMTGKTKVCHIPGGDVSKANTISISWDSVGSHLAHGDELATCEFLNYGSNSRSLAGRDESGSQSDANADPRTIGRDTPITHTIGASAAPAASSSVQRTPMRTQRGIRAQKQR